MDISALVEPRALRELRAAQERRDEEIRRLVSEAIRAGVRSQDIAAAIGISRSTLWRRYADELRRRDDVDDRPHPGPAEVSRELDRGSRSKVTPS